MVTGLACAAAGSPWQPQIPANFSCGWDSSSVSKRQFKKHDRKHDTKFLSDWRLLFCDNLMIHKDNKAGNRYQKPAHRSEVTATTKKDVLSWLLILCFEKLSNYFNFRCISAWSYDQFVQKSPKIFFCSIFFFFTFHSNLQGKPHLVNSDYENLQSPSAAIFI